MSALELNTYIDKMQKRGTWGDGIMLSVAVNVYGRPIEIMSADGSFAYVDMAESTIDTEPIRLGLADKHYVSIRKTDVEQATVDTPSTSAREGQTEHFTTPHPRKHVTEGSFSKVCLIGTLLTWSMKQA
jgi:hypothetical protein